MQFAAGLQRGIDALEHGLDASDGVCDVFVFPDANHDPPRRAECSILLSVSLAVAFDLGAPEARIALGPRHVVRAPVPKAAVYKHRDPSAGERDVGADDDPTRGHAMVHSVAPALSVQTTAHLKLGARVDPAVRTHRQRRVRA